MFKRSIYKEVIKAIQKRIDDAQQQYEQDVQRLQATFELDKEIAFRNTVESVLAKVID